MTFGAIVGITGGPVAVGPVANEPVAVGPVANEPVVPLHQVGDVVASCDFDSSNAPDGMLTDCPGMELSQLGTLDFYFADSSDSADTGPTADHTGGGKCHNGTGSGK